MRRFLDFNTYFRSVFNEKVVKLSLSSTATCPNRDGSISNKACIFCSERGSGDFTSLKNDIDLQIEEQKKLMAKKWKSNSYIAYFQNFTNTYGDIDYYKNLYNHVIEKDEIVGLSIATRADCLGDDVMDMLDALNKKTFLFLELGMQSIHDESLEFINRGYDHKTFDLAARKLKDHNIKFLTHVIFGLPGESKEQMLESVKYLKDLKPFGVKFHSLYIQEDARLAKYYRDYPFKLLTKDQYVNLVCDSIEILPKNIVIHRLTGDADKEKLIAPLWAADKLSVIGSIEKELKKRKLALIDF